MYFRNNGRDGRIDLDWKGEVERRQSKRIKQRNECKREKKKCMYGTEICSDR